MYIFFRKNIQDIVLDTDTVLFAAHDTDPDPVNFIADLTLKGKGTLEKVGGGGHGTFRPIPDDAQLPEYPQNPP